MARVIMLLAVVVSTIAPALSGGSQLVSTQGLEEMLKKGDVSVIDLRSDINEYLKGHIPEAVYLHYETLRASKHGVPADMLSGEAYAGVFSRLGLRMDKPIVMYSAGDANNFYATFLGWLLAGFGHPSVYLLDGGYDKWVKEKRTISREYPVVEMSSFPAKDFTLDMVPMKVVKNAMEKREAVLVDARPMEQYEGKAGSQMRLGHIPGAISHFWASDLMQTETGKVWKPVDELRASYEKQGITADKNVIVYCNTGTEATHLYFALRNLLGYKNVSVYVPSYTEWAAIKELPVQTAGESK